MRKLTSIRQGFDSLPFWQKVPLRALIATMGFVFFLVTTQSIQIFPGAVTSLFNTNSTRQPRLLPQEVESIRIKTKDGELLESWRLPISNSSLIAIIFHGNAGDVANFFTYQQYFKSIGITSYGFDYRGFGTSTGWPSEEGLEFDAEAVVEYVLQREHISPQELILVGVSIGSGPASYSAKKFSPKSLVLFSPFESLVKLVEEMPLLGFLSPLLFFEFPVAQNVASLSRSCLVVAHGEKDDIIPFEQGRNVFKSYSGDALSAFVESSVASHNDILFKTHERVTSALKRC